jgi:hypothetical protein
MKSHIEIEWVEVDKQRGTIILSENGIYFHPYNISEETSDILGDAVSIGGTGVFGAINLQKKLSEIPDVTKVAKELRRSKSLEELVKDKVVTFFPWRYVETFKKKILSGVIILGIKNGIKLKIKESHNQKDVFNLIKEHTA